MNRPKPIHDHAYYHVYNRGNDRRVIFRKDSDYKVFLEKMKELAGRYTVSLPVHTLMPNHYHLIAIQSSAGSLSAMMGALATSTAKRYNLKYGHTGHVFQGPFRYEPISEETLWNVACYIHLNPVRAGFVRDPEDWEFSNFAEMRESMSGAKGFLHQRSIGVEGNLLQVWRGYPEYVIQRIADEESMKHRQRFPSSRIQP